jgi:hypothetical protein
VPQLVAWFRALGVGLGAFDFLFLPRRTGRGKKGFGTTFGCAFVECATPHVAEALYKAVRQHALPLNDFDTEVNRFAGCTIGIASESLDMDQARAAELTDLPFAFVREETGAWRCIQWGRSFEARAKRLEGRIPARRTYDIDSSRWLQSSDAQ